MKLKKNFLAIKLMGEYTEVAAGRPDREVMMRLYRGEIIGIPTPSTEIKFIHWVGKEDRVNPKVSPIIGNKTIPDLDYPRYPLLGSWGRGTPALSRPCSVIYKHVAQYIFSDATVHTLANTPR